jgi:hypothetical protein
VDEALEPLLQQALPRVIDVLNEDPDAIRSLVRDQSTGIAVEMTETVRFKAADADDRIDRIVRRVLRRKPLAVPGPIATPGPIAAGPIATPGPIAAGPIAAPGPPPVLVGELATPIEARAATGAAEVDGTASAQRDGHPSVEPDARGRR